MARHQPTAQDVDARVARAKARLAELAQGAADAPGPAIVVADRVATQVRAWPWRGVGVALGIGLALGLSRGRGVRAVARVAGPLGAALATGLVRQFVLGSAAPASTLDAKAAEVRSRTTAR